MLNGDQEKFNVLVVLTYPGYHTDMAPLRYVYVIAVLKRSGARVSVVKVPSTMDDASSQALVSERLFESRPDLVITGTSDKFPNNCPAPTIGQAAKVAEIAKSTRPNCATLLVGPLNVTVHQHLPEEVCLNVVGALRENKSLPDVPTEKTWISRISYSKATLFAETLSF